MWYSRGPLSPEALNAYTDRIDKELKDLDSTPYGMCYRLAFELAMTLHIRGRQAFDINHFPVLQFKYLASKMNQLERDRLFLLFEDYGAHSSCSRGLLRQYRKNVAEIFQTARITVSEKAKQMQTPRAFVRRLKQDILRGVTHTSSKKLLVVDLPDWHNQPLLLQMAASGNIQAMNILLDMGAFVDVIDGIGKNQNAMTRAIQTCNRDVAELLLKHGSNPNFLVNEVNAQESIEMSVLTLAVKARCDSIIRLLLKFGAKPDGEPGPHPLSFISDEHDLPALKALLEAPDFKLDYVDARGQNVLFTKDISPWLFRFIIEAAADRWGRDSARFKNFINKIDDGGMTPLQNVEKTQTDDFLASILRAALRQD